jgi:hypothetical protein
MRNTIVLLRCEIARDLGGVLHAIKHLSIDFSNLPMVVITGRLLV